MGGDCSSGKDGIWGLVETWYLVLHLLTCTSRPKYGYLQTLKTISIHQASPLSHSQTFENKSSPPANPVAGFGCVPDAEETGAALLHPPKSSSAVTFGGAVPAVLNPPPPPGTILWFANEVPPDPQPKSPELACIGAGLLITGLVFAVLHASFDPQASFPQPLIVAAGGAACGFGGGAGCDRLKTEDWVAGGEDTVCFGGAAGGAAGVEKSNRSPMAEFAGAGDMPGAESKAPKPLDELKPREG